VLCNVPGAVLTDFRTAGTPGLYRPRQVIFSEGTPSAALYLVCRGTVKLYHSDRFGRDHILELAGPGTLLGELSPEEDGVMSVSAEAVTEAQVSCLSRDRIGAFLQRHPETALRFLGALSRELAVARRKVRELALKGAESRLAGVLMQLAHGDSEAAASGGAVRLRYTRRELAEMIGVSTETAIRLLGKLKRKGVIAAAGRDLRIADMGRLVRIAQYDEASPAEDAPEP
jgi:CRP-like cAMP-binding protein